MNETLRSTLALALAAASPAVASETEANRSAVRRIYEEAVNAGRLEVLSDLVAPEFALPDGSRGPSAFASNITALRAGFPDIRFTVEQVVAEGDRVAVRWTWTGTHTGTFRGFAATGTAVHDTGLVLYTFASGRIVGAVIETDRLGVLQQIGVVPRDLAAPRTRK